MFNIIDHASGFKADFIILKDDEYREIEFNRRVKVDFWGMPVYLVSTEDLLLSKLIWIQDIQSAIQMDDIRNLAVPTNVDWNYINRWMTKLNLNTFSLLKYHE